MPRTTKTVAKKTTKKVIESESEERSEPEVSEPEVSDDEISVKASEEGSEELPTPVVTKAKKTKVVKATKVAAPATSAKATKATKSTKATKAAEQAQAIAEEFSSDEEPSPKAKKGTKKVAKKATKAAPVPKKGKVAASKTADDSVSESEDHPSEIEVVDDADSEKTATIPPTDSANSASPADGTEEDRPWADYTPDSSADNHWDDDDDADSAQKSETSKGGADGTGGAGGNQRKRNKSKGKGGQSNRNKQEQTERDRIRDQEVAASPISELRVDQILNYLTRLGDQTFNPTLKNGASALLFQLGSGDGGIAPPSAQYRGNNRNSNRGNRSNASNRGGTQASNRRTRVTTDVIPPHMY